MSDPVIMSAPVTMSAQNVSWLYEFSSITIATTLFFSIILFNEFGFRIGRFVQAQTSDEVKSLTGSIQASILGLLALLLSFNFSMSMQRYDARNTAMINETNVIQQSILEFKTLPPGKALESTKLMEQYIDAKLELSGVSIVSEERRNECLLDTVNIHKALLALSDDREYQKQVFKLIEQQTNRNAVINTHVPDVVLLLLFVVFFAAVTILGYSVGLSGRRMGVPIVMVSLLITLIVFIIIDLDRPKRGFIQIDPSPLLYLKQYPY